MKTYVKVLKIIGIILISLILFLQIVVYYGFIRKNLVKSSDDKIVNDIKNMHRNIKFKHGDLMNELPEQLMAYKHIDKNDKVLEMGANIGTNSLIINSKLANKDQHVAIEPLRDVVKKLHDNKVLNNAGFHIFNGAISDNKLMEKGWKSRVIPSTGLEDGWHEIDTISYDQFKSIYNINFNTIVADCEGCLNDILIKNPILLKTIDKLIIEHDFTTDADLYIFNNLMKNNGFSIIDSMKKGDKYCPDIHWADGREIDPFFVSVWKRLPKVAFVSGFTGRNDENPKIPNLPSNIHKYFITNVKNISSVGWNHIEIPSPIGNSYLEYSLASKPLKVFPQSFLNHNFDFVVWFDNKIDLNYQGVMKAIEKWDSRNAMLLKKHEFLCCGADVEYEAAIKQNRYYQEKDKYIKYIKEEEKKGYPINGERHFQTGCIIYNMNHPLVYKIQNTWMEHINRCGIECQISMYFIAQQFKKEIDEFKEPLSVKKHNKSNYTFHVVVVCTPNYNHIGAYGVNSLHKYCQKHGYDFTLITEAISDLHVNFTKNSAAISTLSSSTADYIVTVDADIEIKDFSQKLEKLLLSSWKIDAVMYSPKDFFASNAIQYSIINSGFIIWKRCKRAIEINKIWLDMARNQCKIVAQTHPRQQNVFDKCVYNLLNPGELVFLDHNIVGMLYSSFISQTKDTKSGWIKAGMPSYPIQL